MDSSTDKQPSPAADARHHDSPEGKIIGAFAPTAVDGVIAALVEAGVAEDQVDIVTPEDAPHFEASIDRQGFTGTLTRFMFSLGDDLDELEQLRAELRSGSVLVGVPVQGEAAIQHIHSIMREHGGHSIVSFGRWTITPFEEQ